MDFMEASKMYNIKRGLENEINKKVILIDCMDTIIHRNVSLGQLMKKWSKKIGKEFSVNPKYLYNYRSSVIGGSMHNVVPIEMIYDEISNQCIYFKMFDQDLKNLFCKRAHEIEMECEYESHKIIIDTVDFIKTEKKKGTKIYCVSDFRLSSSDIKAFFIHLDIIEYFEDVFSSCDMGKTKKEGDLYQVIMKKINVEPSECIMIGDNFKSDCINAARNGIQSCWLER